MAKFIKTPKKLKSFELYSNYGSKYIATRIKFKDAKKLALQQTEKTNKPTEIHKIVGITTNYKK